MTKHEIVTAFDIIADINKLEKVEGTTNIFTDEDGVRYYLDRYGFHTVMQFSNHKLLQQERKLAIIYNSIIGSVVPSELMGKKTRSNIRAILANHALNEEQKLSSISSIINKLDPHAMRLQDQLILLISRYVTG